MPKLFMIGHGYIGGTVLTDLLATKSYDISVLNRDPAREDKLRQLGVTPIRGSLSDHDVIAGNVSASDITLHTATADDMPSVEAVLDGLRKRVASGNTAAYLHTSGTCVINDDSKSEFRGDKFFNDTDADIDVADSAPHRVVDLAIKACAKELGDKARIQIIAPPLIYGGGTGPSNVESIQAPTLIRAALKRGSVGHVGPGKAAWSMIHVADLARAYVTIIEHMTSKDYDQSSAPLYWFAENGETVTWKELADMIAKVMVKDGSIKDSKTSAFTEAEHEALLFGSTDKAFEVLGFNSLSKAERLRALGWKSREGKLYDSLPDTVTWVKAHA